MSLSTTTIRWPIRRQQQKQRCFLLLRLRLLLLVLLLLISYGGCNGATATATTTTIATETIDYARRRRRRNRNSDNNLQQRSFVSLDDDDDDPTKRRNRRIIQERRRGLKQEDQDDDDNRGLYFQCFQSSTSETGCFDTPNGGQDCMFDVCTINNECCYLNWSNDCVSIAQNECTWLIEYIPPPSPPTPDPDRPDPNNPPTAITTLSPQQEQEQEWSDCYSRHCTEQPECCLIPACYEVVGRLCIPGLVVNENENEEDGGGGSESQSSNSNSTLDNNSTNTTTTNSPNIADDDDDELDDDELNPQNNQNSCFETSKDPGCNDPICEAILCSVDDFCCERTWDFACVQQAMDYLDVCKVGWPIANNNCFYVEPFGRPNCNDPVCLDAVCDVSPSCCSVSYDVSCVDTAKRVCRLPEPANHCMETSPLPGCTNTQCLNNAVCQTKPSCCTDAYDAECVEIAKRHHGDVCPAPKPTNDCTDPSPIGGCVDTRCQRSVCDLQSDCCNTATEVGQWHDVCTRLADEFCQPKIFKRPPGPCRSGFTCSETEMVDCGDLRKTARDDFRIGDIYAGIYCGDVYDDGYNLKNCDVGMYCPTPEERYPCPQGFFCPHKTAVPDIVCNRCQEGAIKLERDWFGYVGLIAVVSLSVAYIGLRLVRRYNQDFIKKLQNFERTVFRDRLQEFEHRIFELRSSATGSSAFSLFKTKKSSPHEMKKLKLKIELINKRLTAYEENRSNTSKGSVNTDTNTSSASATNKNGNSGSNSRLLGGDGSTNRFISSVSFLRSAQVRSGMSTGANVYVGGGGTGNNNRNNGRFDARRVFDALDTQSEGEVSFDELNIILGLNDLELYEFKRRMNELAGYKRDRQTVTRPVFCKYFLNVLKETSQLTVSFEEAEALFDEMADEMPVDSGGTEQKLHMSAFYNSSMSNFLSDLQICDLIRRFKKLNEELGSSSRRPSIFFSGSTNFRLPNVGRMSITAPAGATRNNSVARRRSSFRSTSTGGQGGQTKDTRMVISRDDFVENYPQLLLEVTMDNDSIMGDYDMDDDNLMGWEYPGVDICFQNLSLNIQIGDKTLSVVDEVTGRIKAQTMTALMGGSGAGKTSLLNALCGRAFYGEVTGSVYLNGHKSTSFEDFKDAIGFVPQDDIVYPELTVRENLMYAGRFRLPKGTDGEEIDDLVDTTMANLGLSRVADSPVGDVRRRGVSGGERKRVNIGLELMANPSILFLDEPTSGLDASSALLVMKSLKHLVEKDGVTVVSVIHQPRKFIYDLFDSLILLGVGGKMVYHGPTDGVAQYFKKLHYHIPEGESVADWLIDISSGRLEPACQIAKCRKTEYIKNYQVDQSVIDAANAYDDDDAEKELSALCIAGTAPQDGPSKDVDKKADVKEAGTAPQDGPSEDVDKKADVKEAGTPTPMPEMEVSQEPVTDSSSISGEFEGGKPSYFTENKTESVDERQEAPAPPKRQISNMTVNTLDFAGEGGVTDNDVVGGRGVTSGKVIQAAKEAKNRRDWLYVKWNKYFDAMEPDLKKNFDPPSPYALPVHVDKPSFLYQLSHQTRRIFTVAWRNRLPKFVDSIIIVGAMIVITALDGVAVVTEDIQPDVPFEVMARPNLDDSQELFTGLFRFAVTRQIQYALKAGIVICSLVGLTATKVLTEKRLQFFRESASGYDLNAYYLAVNIMATTEHTTQVLIAAFFAIWIRNPLASSASFIVHFVLLAWVVVSWSLLIPMVIPPESVMIVGAFFFVFCGLMFSGAFPPILYYQIYEGGFREIFAGWIAATRFFFEAITVGEYRCLPEQTGYTIPESATNRAWNSSLTVAIGYAGHDPYAVRKSCDGWYWGVVPSLLVGFTVRYAAWLCMYGFQRGLQTKKPLWGLMRSDSRIFRNVMLYLLLLCGFIALSTWTFIRDVPYEEPDQELNILDFILS